MNKNQCEMWYPTKILKISTPKSLTPTSLITTYILNSCPVSSILDNSNTNRRHNNEFDFGLVTFNVSIVNYLKISESTCAYGINAKEVKTLSNIILIPLIEIINIWIREFKYPTSLKTSKVIPV